MLQLIRDKAHGWPTRFFFSLLTISFVFFGVQGYQTFRGQPEAATVNGEMVTQAAWEHATQQIRRFQPEMSLTVAKQQALAGLIQEILWRQYAHTMGITMTTDMLDQAILAIPAFQADGHFSNKRYLEVLQQNGVQPAQFKAMMESQLLREQIEHGVVSSAFVLPGELADSVNLLEQKRRIRYVRLEPIPHAVQKKLGDPKPEEIEAAYQARIREFTQPARVQVGYILLDQALAAPYVQVKGSDVRAYYDAHRSDFVIPARKQLRHIFIPASEGPALAQKIIQQLQDKTLEFQTAVKRYSQDKPSVAQGGILGWMEAHDPQWDPGFRAAWQALTQPGQVYTAPVETPQGYHVIALADSQTERYQPFADVQEAIRHRLEQEQIQQWFHTQRERLVDLAYQYPHDLAAVARDLDITGLVVQTSDWFNAQGKGFGLTEKNSALAEQAFEPARLKERLVGEVIDLAPGQAWVSQVQAHQSETVQPLEAVRDTVVADLRLKAQREALQAYAQEQVDHWSQASTKNPPLEIWARTQGFSVKQQTIGRDANNLPAGVVQTAFAITADRPYALAVPPLGSRDPFYVVHVENLIPGDLHAIPEPQRLHYHNALQGFWGRQLLAHFQSGLVRSARISYGSGVQDGSQR